MQIKNPQRVFADGSETFSYVTVHAAYLSAKENIEGKIKKITSPEKKNVFLNKIEDAFLARKNLICNSVSKNTPTKTQLFFSDTNLEKADKTTQSQPAKPNPMEP